MSQAPDLAPPGGWAGPAAPRLRAPPPAQRGLVFRAVSRLSRFFGRPDVPDVFSVLHLNARLFWAWLYFASRLMPWGRLPAKERELIILRTAWNCRSRYEWGQHVEIALRVGLADDEILRVTRGAGAFAGRPQQALIAACDELCRDRQIGDATWQALSAGYDSKRLIEIVILVGHYVMVAGFLNSAGLALEPPTEAQLQAFLRRVARSGVEHGSA